MPMPAVDTNVLVRLIVRDHPAQTAAAEQFIAKGAWAPLLAVAEAVWVLTSVYEVRPAALATAIEMLLSHESLALENAPAIRDALALFRQHPGTGFTDCLLTAVAQRAGYTPLGTFDRRLARLEDVQLLPGKPRR